MNEHTAQETEQDRPPPRVLRRSDDRMIGGVAGGFADYFGIDPTIARLVFVGLTFWGGAGLLIYLVCWALIPARDQQADSWNLDASTRRVLGVIAIVLGALWAFGWMSSLFWWGPGGFGPGPERWLWPLSPGTLFAAALIAVGVWLYRRGSESSDATEPRNSVPPPPLSPAAPTRHDEPGEPAATTASPAADPATSELATSTPAATALTTTAPTTVVDEPRQPRERSLLGRAALAVALLAVGLGALLDRVGVIDLRLVDLIAIALAAVGVGLIVGAWWGRARWLIAVGFLILPVLFVGMLLPSVSWDSDQALSATAADLTYRPETVEELRDSYVLATGRLVLDLRDLDIPAGEVPVVTAEVGAGELEVLLPDVTAEVRARVLVGQLELPDWVAAGFVVTEERTISGSGPGTVELDLSVRAGQIEVEEGAQ